MNDLAAIGPAIDRLVAEAKAAGSVIRTGEAARHLVTTFPGCEISAREIAQIVARQAIAAGVPIQFTSPD